MQHLQKGNIKKFQVKAHKKCSNEMPVLACEECNFETTVKQNLKVHVERKHRIIKEKEQFECNVCSDKFTSSKILDKHRRTHILDDTIVKCEIANCNKVYENKRSLWKHNR